MVMMTQKELFEKSGEQGARSAAAAETEQKKGAQLGYMVRRM